MGAVPAKERRKKASPEASPSPPLHDPAPTRVQVPSAPPKSPRTVPAAAPKATPPPVRKGRPPAAAASSKPRRPSPSADLGGMRPGPGRGEEFRLLLAPGLTYKELTPELERELILRAKAGDLAAQRQLLEAHAPYIAKMVKKYARDGVSFDDVYQEGRLGFLHGLVNKFDPDRGIKLITYAGEWARSRAARYHADHASTIRVPVHLRDAIHREARGAPPKTTKDPQRLRDGRNALYARSLDAPPPGYDEDATLGDLIEGGIPSPEAVLEQTDTAQRLQSLLQRAMRGLSDRERRVIAARLLGDQEKTLQEIGDELLCSRERIRQLEARALGKLRRCLLSMADRDERVLLSAFMKNMGASDDEDEEEAETEEDLATAADEDEDDRFYDPSLLPLAQAMVEQEAQRRRRGEREAVSKGGYIGVSERSRLNGRYKVTVCLKGGGQKHVGSFSSPVEAALAYDTWALKLRGPGTKLNFPELVTGGRKTPLDGILSERLNALENEAPRKGGRGRANKSGYIGVFQFRKGKYRAIISLSGGGQRHVGTFDSPLIAALSYDEAIMKIRPNARLNFPDISTEQRTQMLAEARLRQQDDREHGRDQPEPLPRRHRAGEDQPVDEDGAGEVRDDEEGGAPAEAEPMPHRAGPGRARDRVDAHRDNEPDQRDAPVGPDLEPGVADQGEHDVGDAEEDGHVLAHASMVF